MIIRIAQSDDLPAIVAIYNQAILTRCSTAEMDLVQVADKQDWFDEHDPEKHPIYVADTEHKVLGWCSLSSYRPGRRALRFTAEISYYIDQHYHHQGIATALVTHAITECPRLQIKTLLAMLLERNTASIHFLKKMGFEKWGEMPQVVDFDGEECNHLYYGKRVDG